MSQVAKLVDPAMLRVYNLEYDSWQTIYFQRFTVIVTELMLVYALQMYADPVSLGPRGQIQLTDIGSSTRRTGYPSAQRRPLPSPSCSPRASSSLTTSTSNTTAACTASSSRPWSWHGKSRRYC